MAAISETPSSTWKAIIRKHGCPTTIKTFRTRREAGLGDQEVSAISGHKSTQMLKRYTHLRAEDLVEKLDRVMG